MILSRYQLNNEPLDIWGAICRGLGITSDSGPAASPQPPVRSPTEVAWTQVTLDQVCARNLQRR